MELELSEDQEFFRDTTRKFLEAECAAHHRPRRWPTTPPASTGPGGGGAPSSAGRRCWCPRTTAAAASRARACSTWSWWPRRWAGWSRPGPLLPANVVAAAAGRDPARRSSGRRSCPGWWPATSSPPGAWPSRAGPWTADRRAARGRGRSGDGFVLAGRQGAGGGGGPGRPAAGHGPDRPTGSPSSWCRPAPPGVTVVAAREPRPGPALRPGRTSTTSRSPARRGRGRGRRRRPPTSSASCRSRWCSSAPRRSAPPTGCSSSPSSTPSTATRSAGRWPPTRRSSTASPT